MKNYVDNRREWVDCAKGMAILLIIYAHVLNGYAVQSPDAHSQSFYFKTMRIAYIAGVHGFFFLSGLFAFKMHERKMSDVLMSKIQTILFPYAVWAIIHGLIKIYFSTDIIHKIKLSDLFHIYLYPVGVTWFLYALFWVFIIYKVLSLKLDIIHILLIAVILYHLPPYTDIMVIKRIFHYFIFFAFGAALSKWSFKDESVKYFTTWLALPVFLLLSYGYINENIQVSKFAVAISSIYLMISISIEFRKNQLFRMISFLGCISLIIYLVHMIPVTAIRVILLNYLNITNIYIYVIIQMILTTVICVLFNGLLEKLKVRRYLFGR